MSHQIQARKPLGSAVFFKTMCGLRPSEKHAPVRDGVGIRDSVQGLLEEVPAPRHPILPENCQQA